MNKQFELKPKSYNSGQIFHQRRHEKVNRIKIKNWSYEEAFKRNLGLINPQEQQILRNSRVAIPGRGGVGGIHAVTVARLGIGKFTIADPDIFEAANFNRQYGASVSSLGKFKVDVMEKIIKEINPEAEIRVFRHPLGPENVDEFLDGSHLVLDGIDAFAIEARRLVYKKAASKGLYVISAGPLGFSTAWLVFDPQGMGFDDYFDISDKLTPEEKFIAFIVYGLQLCVVKSQHGHLRQLDF